MAPLAAVLLALPWLLGDTAAGVRVSKSEAARLAAAVAEERSASEVGSGLAAEVGWAPPAPSPRRARRFSQLAALVLAAKGMFPPSASAFHAGNNWPTSPLHMQTRFASVASRPGALPKLLPPETQIEEQHVTPPFAKRWTAASVADDIEVTYFPEAEEADIHVADWDDMGGGLDDDNWVSELEDVSVIGSGSSGMVIRGRLGDVGPDIAIKAVSRNSEDRARRARDEIEALRRCSGGDVVTFFGSMGEGIAPDIDGIPGLTPDAFMFMEIADGSLQDQLIAKKSLQVSVAQKLRILVEILRGLRKIELAGFAHRDIKPENILVFGDCASESGCHVKIGDLGIARKLRDMSKIDVDKASFAGTSIYMAPEVWRDGRGGRKSDVWSTGVLAFELFVGALPTALRDMASRESFVSMDDGGRHPFRDFVPNKFDIMKDEPFREFFRQDSEVANLIRAMMTKAAWRRPSIKMTLAAAMKIAKSRGVVVPEQQSAQLSPYWQARLSHSG